MFFNKPPSQSDISFLKKSITGIPDISPETQFQRMNPRQIHQLVALRKIVDKHNVANPGQGKFVFTLTLLKQLHAFVEGEKNTIQKVAYKNVLKKIRDDIMALQDVQTNLDDLKKQGGSETAIERAHDLLEDAGESIRDEFNGFCSRVQNDIIAQKSLAAYSLYRASLASERNMYSKLDREGKRMLRRWNDVALEVDTLLATVTHDAAARRNLSRMRDDLKELLTYLDDFALLPWLAPREIVAAIATLDRRLENYQDEYNLAQPDADRIANVIQDREDRDDRRAALTEKVMSGLDKIGLNKALSLGGMIRLVRGTGRAISQTGRFVTRTLPNVFRSVGASVVSTPKRVVQTFGQIARMLGGPFRKAIGLSNKKGGSLDVEFEKYENGRETLGLASTIDRGYVRDFGGVPTTGGVVPMAGSVGGEGGADLGDLAPSTTPYMPPLSSKSPFKASRYDDGFVEPDMAQIYREAVDATAATPGSTQAYSAGDGSLRSFIDEGLNRVHEKLDLMHEDIRAMLGPRPASGVGSESEALMKDKELDMLRAIQIALERIAGKVEGDPSARTGQGSFLERILNKAGMVKGVLSGILQAIGGWRVIAGSLGVLRKLAAGVLRVAAPLMKIGSFVGRILMGPVGAVLGAGVAGWTLGSKLYEEYSMEILDFIDSGVNKITGAINFVSSLWDKGKAAVKKAGDAVKSPFVDSVKKEMDREVEKAGGISPVTKKRAEGLGVDTSTYPTINPKDRSITPPKSTTTPSTTVAPPISKSGAGGSLGSYSAPSASVSSAPSLSSRSPSTGSSVSPLAPSAPMSSMAGQGEGTYSVASGSNMEGLQPGVLSNFNAMVAEYQSLGGKHPVRVNRAFASYEQQAEIYKKYGPGRAARPGNSAHNYGIAIDIDRGAANEMASMGLLAKYGFERPVRGEPWHLQVAGVSAAMAKKGIFSADTPAAQGGDVVAQVGSEGATGTAPTISPSAAAKAGTGSVSTSMATETGLPPEKAAYDPRTSTAPGLQSEGKMAAANPARNVASPSGHGTARIPEFSYADPTFFALNLGALA